MELLRIVSMLFVLLLHANFLGIHAPTAENLHEAPVETFFRIFFEAAPIVAVDVFVLISGWFGIQFSYKKLGAIWFQILFFTIGFWIVFLIFRPSEALTVDKIKGIFLLNGDYWFVKAYIILFLLSPVLNAFIEHATKKQFLVVLITYYVFHTIYGWLMDASVSFTMNGTTGLSFMGLYLLGRYLNIYKPRFTICQRKYDMAVYMGGVALLVMLNVIMLSRGHNISVSGRLYSYASPVVITASTFLLLYFSKLSFSSKLVNWIASSCFAVYLFHCNGFFFGRYYRKMIEYIYYDSGYAVLGIVVYILLIYAIAVLLDKVRIFLWNLIIEN